MNRAALRTGAEMLVGLLCWPAGSLCALNVTTCNGWATNAWFVLVAMALQALGLWLWTSGRCRYERRRGYAWGRQDGEKKADEMMRDFLMSKAVFMVDGVRVNAKPTAPEKAN